MTSLNESCGKGHALDRSVVDRHDFGALVQLTCTSETLVIKINGPAIVRHI